MMSNRNGARRHTLRFPPQPMLKLDPGCVVSSCPLASAVGAGVLYKGGNAVDAAVATALALAVTYPQAGNIGGGGFMMITDPKKGGEVHMLDYRERAPRRIEAQLYDDEGADASKATLGALAAGVPGTIAGLAEAHAKFGTWTWKQLFDVVAPLAEVGVWLTTRQSSSINLYRESLAKFPSTRTYYLPEEGMPPRPGSLFVQPDLAATLRAIGDEGPRAFYEGRIADLIVDQIREAGGVMDREDLAAYRPMWRTPLHRSYRGYDVYLPSLPSAGGIVSSVALGCAEALDVEAIPYGTPEWILAWARVFRCAFGLGNHLAGDPDHLDPSDVVEAHRLGSQLLTRADVEAIERDLPNQLVGDAAAARRSSTTHFSILDRDGMAVSNTYSVNTLFGSKMAVSGAGFLLNNTIADFRIAGGPNWYGLLQGDRNRIAPQRRPASSMTPTIVLKDGQIVMALGSSGGPRIPTAVVQIMASVFGCGLSLSEAVRRPRVHHQLFPDELCVEKGTSIESVNRLAADGHPVMMTGSLGIVAAIRRRLDTNEISAVLDARFGDFW